MGWDSAARSEAADLGSPDWFELLTTQEQIGNAMGLTPVRVNRVLQALGARGVIDRDTPAERCPAMLVAGS